MGLIPFLPVDDPTLLLSVDFGAASPVLPAGTTFTRSTVGKILNGTVMTEAAIDTPRYPTLTGFSKGYLAEISHSNRALYARDLSQSAVWVPTNMTATKTATGIDGVANAASTITATAANGLVSQSISDATSRARKHRFWVRRRTGTGTFSYSINGSSYVNVTLTSQWQEVVSTATYTNPVLQFRLATSGDAVDIDMVNNQDGAVLRSPIDTGATTLTCASDIMSIPFSAIPGLNLARGFTAVLELTPLDVLPNSAFNGFIGFQTAGSEFFGCRKRDFNQNVQTVGSTNATFGGLAESVGPLVGQTKNKIVISAKTGSILRVAANNTGTRESASVLSGSELANINRVTIGTGVGYNPADAIIHKVSFYGDYLSAADVNTYSKV